MKKKNRIRIFELIMIGLVLILTNSCKKEHLTMPPTLTTSSVTDIRQTTAISGGDIIYDGGAPVTSRGVCWSPETTPTVADNKTADGTGTGSFTSSITGLTANTMYSVRAYATNSAGTGYGSEMTFTAQVTDIDGNVYHTVTIGTQVWMVENLKVTKYNDGTAIPLVTDNTAWSNLTTAGYCWYNNDAPTYKDTYGALYNWYTVNTGKLCPAGWHVPNDAEWTTLTTYLGDVNVEGGKLKETGTAHWLSPNAGATNESGFEGRPGGTRFSNGTFSLIGEYGAWWSSSEITTSNAWLRVLLLSDDRVYKVGLDNDSGFSVRCLRD